MDFGVALGAPCKKEMLFCISFLWSDSGRADIATQVSKVKSFGTWGPSLYFLFF